MAGIKRKQMNPLLAKVLGGAGVGAVTGGVVGKATDGNVGSHALQGGLAGGALGAGFHGVGELVKNRNNQLLINRLKQEGEHNPNLSSGLAHLKGDEANVFSTASGRTAEKLNERIGKDVEKHIIPHQEYLKEVPEMNNDLLNQIANRAKGGMDQLSAQDMLLLEAHSRGIPTQGKNLHELYNEVYKDALPKNQLKDQVLAALYIKKMKHDPFLDLVHKAPQLQPLRDISPDLRKAQKNIGKKVELSREQNLTRDMHNFGDSVSYTKEHGLPIKQFNAGEESLSIAVPRLGKDVQSVEAELAPHIQRAHSSGVIDENTAKSLSTLRTENFRAKTSPEKFFQSTGAMLGAGALGAGGLAMASKQEKQASVVDSILSYLPNLPVGASNYIPSLGSAAAGAGGVGALYGAKKLHDHLKVTDQTLLQAAGNAVKGTATAPIKAIKHKLDEPKRMAAAAVAESEGKEIAKILGATAVLGGGGLLYANSGEKTASYDILPDLLKKK